LRWITRDPASRSIVYGDSYERLSLRLQLKISEGLVVNWGWTHTRVYASTVGMGWSSFQRLLGGFTGSMIPSAQSDRLSVYTRRSVFPSSFLNPFRQRGGQHGETCLPPISSVFLENTFLFLDMVRSPHSIARLVLLAFVARIRQHIDADRNSNILKLR